VLLEKYRSEKMQYDSRQHRTASALARLIGVSWLLTGWLLATVLAGGLYVGLGALENLIAK